MRTTHKKLLSLLIVAALVLSFVPAINVPVSAADTDAWAELDATLENSTGDVSAYCPACEATVTWVDKAGSHIGTVAYGAENTHFYFSADTDATGSRFLLIQGAKVCVHLNGKTITSTSEINVQRKDVTDVGNVKGELNIMGDGQYIFTNEGSNANAAIYIYSYGAVSLYGGEFTSQANGEGAVAPVVSIREHATLNNASVLNLQSGATLKKVEGANTVELTRGKLYSNGGVIEGAVNVNELATAVTLVGATKIDKIVGRPAAADDEGTATYTLDVDGLTQGAKIGISGAGSFTAANMSAYAQYFYTEDPNCTIGVTKAKKISVFDNSPIDPTGTTEAGGTIDAYCYYCDETRTWTERSSSTAIASSSTAGSRYHYFVNTDKTFTAGNAINLSNTNFVCVHLNGHDVQANGRAILQKGATLNILGTGSYHCLNSATNKNGAIFTYGTATVNLYGGTISSAGAYPVININNTDANDTTVINMYGGTLGKDLVVNGETTTNPNANTLISLAQGTFNMYSGTIQNGSASASDQGGNVTKISGTFNMYGGTIQNGKNTAGTGGNIKNTGGAFNMYGGLITGGEASTNSGNVVSTTEFHMSGDAKITNGTAGAHSGNLYFSGTATMTDNAQIYGGTAATQPDNVQVGNGTLVMSGNAKITGKTSNGSAVKLNNANAKLVLMDNATLVGNTSAAKVKWPVYVANGQLQIDNNWTGETGFFAMNADTDAYYEPGDTIAETQAICGTYDATAKTFTKGGSVKGNLNYYSGEILAAGGSNGNIILSGAAIVTEEGTITYADGAAAMAAYNGEGFIKLFTDCTLTLTKDAYVDVYGKNVVINNGEYTVGLMNTKNAFTDTEAHPITVENTDNILVAFDNPANSDVYYYFTWIDDNGVCSAHRLRGEIKSVSLRTAAPAADAGKYDFGMYYKANIKCDAFLADKVDSFGAVYSANEITNDFMATNGCFYTTNAGASLDNDVDFYSGLIGFTTEEMDALAAEGIDACASSVYAKPYVCIDGAFVVMDGADYSLNDVVKGLVDAYGDTVVALNTFVETWADYLTIA